MKSFKFIISGNTYEVEIKSFDGNTADIEVNGTPYAVELQKEVKKTKTPTLIRAELPETPGNRIKKKEKGTPVAVVAPLPGSIIDIFVKPGDIVKKGQPILIMEAMKMENRIQAEIDGVVESVKVEKGASVLQGDLLIELI